MPNILVLGDCASAGTNILTQEITGEKGALIEYSLAWNGTYWKDINKWYLKKTKNNRGKITDFSLIPFHAVKYLLEQELINSYWKHISQPIENMSKNGATAYGYYKRLKKYEKKPSRRSRAAAYSRLRRATRSPADSTDLIALMPCPQPQISRHAFALLLPPEPKFIFDGSLSGRLSGSSPAASIDGLR